MHEEKLGKYKASQEVFNLPNNTNNHVDVPNDLICCFVVITFLIWIHVWKSAVTTEKFGKQFGIYPGQDNAMLQSQVHWSSEMIELETVWIYSYIKWNFKGFANMTVMVMHHMSTDDRTIRSQSDIKIRWSLQSQI